MPVAGIDGKVMLSRAPDAAKEAAAQMKQAEWMQARAAALLQKAQAQKRKRVDGVKRGKTGAVRRRQEPGAQQDVPMGMPESDANLPVAGGGHRVDITI